MDKAHPGKFLGNIYTYSLGEGTYRKEDNIFSSLLGEIHVDEESNPPKISVKKTGNHGYKPNIGDEVYAKVLKVNKYQVSCDIVSTKFKKLISPIQATLRLDSVKADFKDFDIFSCYVPGDIILAKIIATDLTSSIFLSTIDPAHGVVFARGQYSDSLLLPKSFDEMICLDTEIVEKRKVAKPKFQ